MPGMFGVMEVPVMIDYDSQEAILKLEADKDRLCITVHERAIKSTKSQRRVLRLSKRVSTIKGSSPEVQVEKARLLRNISAEQLRQANIAYGVAITGAQIATIDAQIAAIQGALDATFKEALSKAANKAIDKQLFGGGLLGRDNIFDILSGGFEGTGFDFLRESREDTMRNMSRESYKPRD